MTDLEATRPCPQCGTSSSVPLAEMAPGNGRPCPGCGAIFTFTGEDASKVEEILDQLRSRFPGASVEVAVRMKGPWWRFWGGSR